MTGIEYEIYKLKDKIELLNIDTISASVVREIERGIEREVEKIKNAIGGYLTEYKGLDRKLKKNLWLIG